MSASAIGSETRPVPASVYAVGFPRWKRSIVQDFLPDSQVQFVRRPEDAPHDATLLIWGQAYRDEPRPVIRMEDAFLRSVGLGADLVRPLSLVLDRRGVYYDATGPSDLEHLLQTADFTPELIDRAQRLRERIVSEGVSKYNVGQGRWQRPTGGHRVILVPGQVEHDASIRYGAPGINTNMGLLRAVRDEHPSAYILYKPHPDVVAGLRAKGQDESEAHRWSHEIVTNVSIAELLPLVDEVRVLTSLAGFEALLRGKPVTCYGQPFYAGWGITNDRTPTDRRTRRLTVDELVAGALILYPTYVSLRTRMLVTPEQALDELLTWRQLAAGEGMLWRSLVRLALKIGKRVRTWIG